MSSIDETIDGISAPGRLATPDEGLTFDELLLASRNHAMPMEAMREDVTPVGMHYVLTHYDVPHLDLGTWRLDIVGEVQRELSLDLEGLRSMPARTVRVTLECAGNGRALLRPRPVSQPWVTGAVGTADWTGVPLADLLADAGLASGAHSLAFTGADHGLERGVEQDYERGLTLEEAMAPDVLVAFEMNGAPLPPQHGRPARLIVPGWYGMTHVKWLRRITVLGHEYTGYQNAVAYRLRQDADEVGQAVTRIEPRALLVPPGFPEFQTRERVLRPGPVVLQGRAWSGWGPVELVEVSVDDGESWANAELDTADHRWAWRRFTHRWQPEPGRHVLRVRAHDATGRVQPTEAQWNRGGFANNGDLPVVVHVLDA